MDVPPFYWINLARATDRRERMTERFARRALANVRVEAVDARDAAQLGRVRWSDEPAGAPMPCYRAIEPVEAAVVGSHLSAIRRAYEDGVAHALVVEDDVTFELWDAWPDGWRALCNALPSRYGVVQLCAAAPLEAMHRLFLERELLVPVKTSEYASAAAYLIERHAMRVLLEHYDRGSHFDIRARSAPSEHVLFCGELMADDAFAGPFIMRVPLFTYEGNDSLIADHHNDFLRPSRAFVLMHHGALTRGEFTRQFSPIEALTTRPTRPTASPRPPQARQERPFTPRQNEIADWMFTSATWAPFLVGQDGWVARHRRIQRPWNVRDLLSERTLQVVPSAHIEAFASALPRDLGPFVLITHSREPIPPSANPAARDRILEHPRCLGWFATHAQQESDPRITPLPLGIEPALAAETHGEDTTDEVLREYSHGCLRFWRAISEWVAPIQKRAPIALVEMDPSTSIRDLSTNVARFLRLPYPRECWAFASRNAMFIAPPDGADSHAIWTALLFGFVVAAPRWRRTEALSGLPVAWFDHPSEVDHAFIATAVERHAAVDKQRVLARLSFRYWYEQMLARLTG